MSGSVGAAGRLSVGFVSVLRGGLGPLLVAGVLVEAAYEVTIGTGVRG